MKGLYDKPLNKFLESVDKIDCPLKNSVKGPIKEEYFSYIPFYQTRDVISILIKFVKEVKYFIDFGSGTGRICAVAKYLGFETIGIEIDKELAELGQKEFGLEKIYTIDAFDFEDYQKSAILYTYMPIANKPLMVKLNERICERALPYSWRVEMLPIYSPFHLLSESHNGPVVVSVSTLLGGR